MLDFTSVLARDCPSFVTYMEIPYEAFSGFYSLYPNISTSNILAYQQDYSIEGDVCVACMQVETNLCNTNKCYVKLPGFVPTYNTLALGPFS